MFQLLNKLSSRVSIAKLKIVKSSPTAKRFFYALFSYMEPLINEETHTRMEQVCVAELYED